MPMAWRLGSSGAAAPTPWRRALARLAPHAVQLARLARKELDNGVGRGEVSRPLLVEAAVAVHAQRRVGGAAEADGAVGTAHASRLHRARALVDGEPFLEERRRRDACGAVGADAAAAGGLSIRGRAAAVHSHHAVGSTVVDEHGQRPLGAHIVLMTSSGRDAGPSRRTSPRQVRAHEASVREARGENGVGRDGKCVRSVPHDRVNEADVVEGLLTRRPTAVRCVPRVANTLGHSQGKAVRVGSCCVLAELQHCTATEAVDQHEERQ